MNMIDSHTHLHLQPLSADVDGVIDRFVQHGGDLILSNAIDVESAHREVEVALEYEQVYCTAGIHPEITIPGSQIYNEYVSDEWIEKEVLKIGKIVDKHKKVLAVGEAGLDYYWVKKLNCENSERIYSLQKHLLKLQLDLAIKKKLPVVLHCRDIEGDKHCESDILKVISCQCGSCVRGLFHSYAGSLSYLDEILDLGFYISFNSIVMFDGAENVRQILDKVPDDKILLETDAPFLIPSTYKKKGLTTSEPYMIDAVANYVAQRKGWTIDRLWEIVDSNFKLLFGI